MNTPLSRIVPRVLLLICLAGLLQIAPRPGTAIVMAAQAQPDVPNTPATLGTGVFRKPVVPGAVISGYFDHSTDSASVVFFDGRHNNGASYGFYFSCSNPSMYDFVGCEDNVNGVNACSPSRQLWYDNHHGTDYEYSANWYTGNACDPARFNGITHPVYAPARGKVTFAGYNSARPANGYHIVMKHDLNNDGNFENDNLRAYYLHFTSQLAVTAGQIVAEGQYLGLGGSTGYSSSPHLHFEVQRSSDNFSYYVWSVDPYGWQGPGSDPWGATNINLWRETVVNYPNHTYLPAMMQENLPDCPNCGEMIRNADFEAGHAAWTEQGVQVIASTADPNLHIQPHSGNWLAWLAGRYQATDSIYQDFTLPQDGANAQFTYYLMVTPTRTDSVLDTLSVNLRRPDGSLVIDLDHIDNTFVPAGQWVQRTVDLMDVTGWQGQNLRLSFEATTDPGGTTKTSFYVDDASLVVSPNLR